ncbi:hypothetical protein NM208_g6471 [Fusarium decemcellulare]|uniref:Uncharacterized protein n=1 Tax=Fusarium decemcellulare TaxID=57161 RepID=A0ACC1SD67_9HYPO|nr:hypothetical protein NM208_g6471 [Fusarium decemcellulare]
MTSTAAGAGQHGLQQSLALSTSLADAAASSDKEGPPVSGTSKDIAILIPDDTDTEGEDYSKGQDPISSQPCATITTSIAGHLNSKGIKHDPTHADAATNLDPTPAESSTPMRDDSIQTHDLDTLADSEPDSPSPDADFGILSGKEPCHGSQNSPAIPSRCTYTPVAATPEVTQRPPYERDVCPTTGRGNAASVRNSSSPTRMSLESLPGQDKDHRSYSPGHIESESSESESVPLLRAQVYPPSNQGLSRCRSHHKSLCTIETSSEDNDEDTEDIDSEDGPDVPEHGGDKAYYLSLPEAQTYNSEDDLEGLNPYDQNTTFSHLATGLLGRAIILDPVALGLNNMVLLNSSFY